MGQSNLEAFPILTTERLTLRQLSENDVHEIFLLRSDTIINRYLNRRPTHTLQAAMDFIKQIKDKGLSSGELNKMEMETWSGQFVFSIFQKTSKALRLDTNC